MKSIFAQQNIFAAPSS